MNMPGVSAALSGAESMGSIGIAVLGKSLDSVKEQGAAMAAMLDSAAPVVDTAAMERSVNPDIGANFDMRI